MDASSRMFSFKLSHGSHVFVLLSSFTLSLSTWRLSGASLIGLSVTSPETWRPLRFLFRLRPRNRGLYQGHVPDRSFDLDIGITNAIAHAWIMHGTVRGPDESGMSWDAVKISYVHIYAFAWAARAPAVRKISRKGKEGRLRRRRPEVEEEACGFCRSWYGPHCARSRSF